MDPEVLILILISMVFLIFTILCIVIGYREKEKTGYIVAMVPFLLFLASVCVILKLPMGLWLIFMASAAVVVIAAGPSVIKRQKRKTKEWYAKYVREVDPSAPLRLRDLFTREVLFTRYGGFRFVLKYGLRKYVFLMWLFTTPTIGGLLLAMSLWLKYLTIGYIISYTFTVSTGIAILTYSTLKNFLKSALKEQKPSEEIRSLNAEDLYRKLLDAYIQVWGSRLGGISALERNIQSCMKQGFNREDAIRKIAEWEFEGIPWET